MTIDNLGSEAVVELVKPVTVGELIKALKKYPKNAVIALRASEDGYDLLGNLYRANIEKKIWGKSYRGKYRTCWSTHEETIYSVVLSK